MEETIGWWWHRFVTRAASQRHPAAAASFEPQAARLAILYRAFGGTPGVRLASGGWQRHRGPRRWLARIAGSDLRFEPSRLDDEVLSLPASIDLFADAPDNLRLYRWLVALAAHGAPDRDSASADSRHPYARNQAATMRLLSRFPGLAPGYRSLVDRCLAVRIAPDRLAPEAAALERLIRAALLEPGSVSRWPSSRTDPQPVPLWIDWRRSSSAGASPGADPGEHGDDAPPEGGEPAVRQRRRLDGERRTPVKSDAPMLLPFRAESLLSIADFVNVDRADDDEPDPQAAARAEDLERVTLAPARRRLASRIRLDLDLPSAACDDQALREPTMQPEWDFRRARLLSDHCAIQWLHAPDAPPVALEPRLSGSARRLRREFGSMAFSRTRVRGCGDGDEIDLDALIRRRTQPQAAPGDWPVFVRSERRARDLACLLLLDLSLSTDAHVDDERRVIDVIRDSATLFGETLQALGDRFAVYGFSSVRRQHVRLHQLKSFEQPYDHHARGRIAAIKPGFYTRIGAAARTCTELLAEHPAQRRLLVLLSDGKPHDLDHYDGRYGIEDTREALAAARSIGVSTFCVTIDRDAGSYLGHLFGRHGYAVVRRPDRLPRELMRMYATLTGV